MGRKTAADRARNSTAYYKDEIQKAYGSRNFDDPLEVSMRWLRAALSQRARENPKTAPELYKRATDQIAGFAEQIQTWIITESEQEAT